MILQRHRSRNNILPPRGPLPSEPQLRATKATTTRPDWTAILQDEPRLLPIAQRASAAAMHYRHRRPQDFWRLFEAIKRDASRYVGWNATRSSLATAAAYEVVVSELARIMESHRSPRSLRSRPFNQEPSAS